MRRTIKTDVFCLFITLDPEQIISRITSGKAQIISISTVKESYEPKHCILSYHVSLLMSIKQ